MHALEKILARASGRESVTAGEIVLAEVDVAEVNDLYLQVVKSFFELGGVRVKHPQGVSFVFDHYSPAPTIKAAQNQKSMREFCLEMAILNVFDIGEGICHQVLAESGKVGPGVSWWKLIPIQRPWAPLELLLQGWEPRTWLLFS